MNALNNGIARISNNDLSFRFPISDANDEFDSISSAINRMSENLLNQRQTLRTESEKRMKAEIEAVQAHFDPHFLCNTLECIKVRLTENGDYDSAEMIHILAHIFKGFMRSDTFVSMNEEISLINMYLNLYRLRYRDAFHIYYNIAPRVSQASIMRNMLQPVVENYFTHGFMPERSDNILKISALPDGENYILISLENNGLPISSKQLSVITEDLKGGASCGRYGLSNIQCRIRHFYGSESGLTITSNADQHTTTIHIRIKAMTVKEHEQRLQDLARNDIMI